MTASLPHFLRRAKSPLRATLLVAAITLVVGVAWAQTRIDPNGVNVSGSVIGDDVLYSIGGGRAVALAFMRRRAAGGTVRRRTRASPTIAKSFAIDQLNVAMDSIRFPTTCRHPRYAVTERGATVWLSGKS